MNIVNVIPFLKDNAEDFKVHFALGNAGGGADRYEPLYKFLSGDFEEWQRWQNQGNFGRSFIISLITFDKDEWLFAGMYRVHGQEEVAEPWHHYMYDTELMGESKELIGRLTLKYEKTYRNSYPYLENCIDDLEVSQILKEPYSLDIFPGFSNIRIGFNELKHIVDSQITSWKSSMEIMKGIYVISDLKTGKSYVGKADGEYGLWSRWSTYAKNGHGGNKELRELLRQDPNYADNFIYGVLEVLPMNVTDDRLDMRESHWKNILLTRQPFGLNHN